MLRQLDLNDNELVGSINIAVGNLTVLNFIQLHNNQMTGTIPSEIGLLSTLGKRI